MITKDRENVGVKKERLMSGQQNESKIVDTLCNSHCGGTCDLKVHVRDGKIIRIESVTDENGLPGSHKIDQRFNFLATLIPPRSDPYEART